MRGNVKCLRAMERTLIVPVRVDFPGDQGKRKFLGGGSSEQCQKKTEKSKK